MLTHPRRPEYSLVQLSDLAAAPPQGPAGDYWDVLATTARWAEDYLCHPHPELGRTGPVCPYVRTSLEQGLFYLTVSAPSGARDAHDDLVLACRDWFLELPPRDGHYAQFKTILILCPGLSPAGVRERVDATQRRLRPGFVARGMMLGEFHPGPPQKPGLWNPEFRPLASPVPLLAVRRMVPADILFLRDDAECTALYLEAFRGAVPHSILPLVAGAARAHGLDFEHAGPAPGASAAGVSLTA